MPDRVVSDFPLFPLGLVALPHELVPLNIFTRGTRPFRIVDERDDLAYPAGTVEFLVDKAEAADAKTQTAAHEAYGALVEHATDRQPDAEDLQTMTAYQMAATVDFGLE